jgi:hypothetical protein
MRAEDIEDIKMPLCAQCGKPVQGMQVTRDDYKSGHIITVECHGQKEEYFASDYQDIPPPAVMNGIAFGAKHG